MTNDAIIKFVETKNNTDKALNIHFKQRSTITGLFIQGNDYQELKSKNFWRIVSGQNIEQWRKTKDMNLARIFNGMEFTRLSAENNNS
ncbi:MAG: short-chain dehydrogenase [Chitinophagaceae bacterium]